MHINPPFRAEHTGSLLRYPPLREKRQELKEGTCAVEELRLLEDDAIQHVVNLQQEVGMRTITDGEARRGMFFEGVFDQLEGMSFMPDRPITEFKQYIPHIGIMYAMGIKEAETIFCSGKIKRIKPFYVDQFNFIKTLVPSQDVKHIKVNICSPSWFHQRHGSDLTYDLSVYKTDSEYFEDLAVAYRQEFKELYDSGCRHIQIDDPTFCYFCDQGMISGMEKAGVDHVTLLDTYIRAINLCTRDRPSDLTISLHTCRGNYKGGMHFSEGPYDRIAQKLFNELDVDAYFLEYDDERSGNFDALKHVPSGKTIVLGIMSSKKAELESVDYLKSKVYEAAEAMSGGNSYPPRSKEQALNQLCISPQCGFAATWEGNKMTEEDEKNKLRRLIETARQIWGEQ